jgi:hypothetical protein
MDIRLPSSGQTPRPGANRLGGSGSTGHVRSDRAPESDAGAPGGAGDRVELSPDALALQQRGEVEPVPSGELGAERLRAIGERLASGHYDRPEVHDTVLRALIRDLDAALG